MIVIDEISEPVIEDDGSIRTDMYGREIIPVEQIEITVEYKL